MIEQAINVYREARTSPTASGPSLSVGAIEDLVGIQTAVDSAPGQVFSIDGGQTLETS
jgi:hypothetical protein